MRRRKFTRETKTQAIDRVRKQGLTILDVARDLDIHEDVLRRWIREFSLDPLRAFPGKGQMRSRRTSDADSEGPWRDLREQYRRFDAALNNMSQGLCMFDADQRMIVCNEKYRSLFNIDADVVKPGVTLRTLFQHTIDKGVYSDLTVEDLLNRRMTQVAQAAVSLYDQDMADGKTIEILISPMASGGWVATFTDVTEIRRVERERTAALAQLQERNMLLDATLESMAKGLCVFDTAGALLIYNRCFVDIFRFMSDTIVQGALVLDLLKTIFEHSVATSRTEVNGDFGDFKTRLNDRKRSLFHRQLEDGRVIAIHLRPLSKGGWVITFEDISEQERAIDALREQHCRFDAALNNMSHGLSMFDSHFNLIVCNRRYLEIYGMSAEVVQPGAHLLDIVTHAKTLIPADLCGSTDDHIEHHLAQLAAGHYLAYRELSDGRTIKVVHKPNADGGWVVIHEDVTEKKRAERHIIHMARHDALTALANRAVFQTCLEDAVGQLTDGAKQLAVMCVDLDNFKAVNDTGGHYVGDRLLRIVADRLRRIASDDDTVARLGGDEFAILKFVSSTSEAVSFAQAVISSLSETVVIDDVRVQTGASVGIALAPLHDTVPTRLMQCADLALYRAKSEGRGTFCFFEREMDERAQARRSLEFDLRQALPRNEFHLVFQPLVRAGDSCLIGLEALLRWERPGHGLVPPAEFIPIAEKSGLIIGIGEWALREACRTAAEWPQTISVAVNLSPIQFKKPGLVAMITNALASSGLPPSRLDLEITEAVLLQDDEKTENTLKQLRSLGIRISIDDFGVGYSSLSYLRRFDVDKIKIDQSFISHLDSRGKNFAILQSIGELGARLGLETVAEGIETETQLEMAQNAGCTELQGYLIGRPLSAMDVLSLISRSDLGASASQDVPSDKSISAIRSISNSTDRNNPQASADTIEAHEIARRRST